jgi:cell division protein FtsA
MEPGEEILHVIPQGYTVDDRIHTTEPVGMLGAKLTGKYHLVIGKTLAMNTIKRCLGNANVNLKLKRLILEPLASAAAVLDADEKEMGVAMVDIGGGTTDLVIYYDNIVRHTAVIPFGGNVVTEDIKEGCGVLLRHAEAIKIQYGLCLSNLASDNNIISIKRGSESEPKEISFKTLSKIIDARMEEIVGAIMFELDRSGFADKLNAGIVFTGGGSMLTNFKQFAELKTGLSVRIGKPVYLSADSDQDLVQPCYSTAIGLIIEGFEYEKQPERQENIWKQEIDFDNKPSKPDNDEKKPTESVTVEDKKQKTSKAKKSKRFKIPFFPEIPLFTDFDFKDNEV